MKTMPSPIHSLSLKDAAAHTPEAPELAIKPAATRKGCRIEVRESERDSFSEYHVTATFEDGGATVDDLLAELAGVMAQRAIQPIQEKFYGRTTAREDVLKRRVVVYQRHGLDADVPVTWIEGTPLPGGDFAGVQIWGVVPHGGETCVRTVENPATGRGRIWTGRAFKMLHLPCVRGTMPDGSLASGHTAQAQQMFTNAGLGLEAHGMVYTDVVRTWIYVSRLLDWYGDLNRVRTAHFKKVGIGVEGGSAFPASTGIQGRSADEECMMDVLALKSDGPAGMVAEAIRCSPRQDSSFNYGSAFSRGMTLTTEGRKTVHVSGTASINTAGLSTHTGDAEMQSLETLMSIAAILEAQGGGLHNITSATVFCKDQAAWEAWKRVTRLLQVPDFPKVCVLADVCRHDLLVEMESVSVI